jgi:hypothetical protein
MRIDGRNLEALAKDLEAAREELLPLTRGEPDVWTRSRRGKWTGGRHLEHVALLLERCTADFESALQQWRQGTLPARPGRGPLEAMFIAMVVERGMMPRGGAPSWGMPSPTPEPAAVARRLRSGVERLLVVGRGLDPESRDTLWIWNPMISFRWHYRYPEMVRVQAVHFRHHAAQVRELAR